MHEAVPLAVIGCGAISEFAYLPALAANSEWRAMTWLVEPNTARGRFVAERFGFLLDQVVASQEELPPTIRVAINATPSHLHLATTTALIVRGINVLVEKPFAENAHDARMMVEAAAGRCVLSVNQSRRAGPSNALVRDVLRSGKLGSIRRITWHEGRKFDWPTQSGFNFRRPWRGRPRGVLLDIGIHVLDLICWWLEATPTVLSAEMDGHDGPEASMAAQLAADQTLIEIKLSYLAKLKNHFIIEGTKGRIRGSTTDFDRIELQIEGESGRTVKARGTHDPVIATTRIIANVIAASAGREALLIDALSTIAALEAIDEIYAKAHDILPKCYLEFVEDRLPLHSPLEQEKVA